MQNEKYNNSNFIQYYTNLIQEDFDTFFQTIIDDSKLCLFDKEKSSSLDNDLYEELVKDNDSLQSFIESIALSFNSDIFSNVIACAEYSSNRIYFNSHILYNNKSTLIHEFAHLAIYYFSNKKITGHTLEFAIFNYCLSNRYSFAVFRTNHPDIILDDEFKKYTSKQCFFKSYDIHEDPAYELLSINSSHFDTMIKNIEFYNLKDLYDKSYKLAKRIRRKTVAL